MKEEGFNPNAVITDQVIDALANIQDHEPGSFREHTEKLTDILLDDFELMEPDNLKRNLDLVQFFRFYAGLIEKLHPQASSPVLYPILHLSHICLKNSEYGTN